MNRIGLLLPDALNREAGKLESITSRVPIIFIGLCGKLKANTENKQELFQ